MATSGSFTGGRGTTYSPYLKLDWYRIDLDVGNNRSLIRLDLYLVADYAVNFTASKNGNLHGNPFTYTGGMTSTGTKHLKTVDVWVGHNPGGDKSEYFSATFDIQAKFSGVMVNTLTVGGWADLDSIPRASQLTMSKTTFTMGEQVTIYTNKKANYTHTLTYIFGNTTINIAFGVVDSFTWTVPLDMAKVIPSATAGIGTMVCSTYNGDTLIGQTTVGFTVYVPESVKPTVSGLTVGITGNGKDKTMGKYIQSISKVTASFSDAGAYDSSITSRTITVRRLSDLADSQTISGGSGTIANPFSLSGTYYIVAEVYDSRGRYASASTTITVDAYSPPSIATFTANRASPSTTVVSALKTTWSPLGTSNPATITVDSVDNIGTKTNLYTLTNSTAGLVETTRTYTAQSDASSYTYTMKITDSFGKYATAVVTVGTAFVEATIAKGKGMGIAKVWERGALDVGGDAFVNGIEVVGNVGQPTPGNNLNTCYKQGRYTFDPTTVGKPPYGSYGTVEVVVSMGSTHNNSNNWIWQFAYSTDSIARISFRSKVNGGNWSFWSKINDSNPILAKASAFGIQSMQPKIWQRVQFNSVDANPWGIFNASTNLWTVPEEGWYEFTYSMHWHQSIGTGLDVEIWGPNGSLNKAVRVVTGYAPANGWNYWFGSVLIYAVAGTGCEFVAKHGDGDYARTMHGVYGSVRKL